MLASIPTIMHAPVLQLIGPEHNVELFGIRLLGVDAQNGRKFLFTLVFFLLLYLISKGLQRIAHTKYTGTAHRVTFWTRQGISLTTFLLGILSFVSIWFDNPARLDNLDAAKIGIASGTYEIVGLPPIRVLDERLEAKRA